MKTFKGTTAIVTGGGSGIGFAVAQALVNADANVIIASRRGDFLAKAAKGLNALNKGKAVPVVCDIRKVKFMSSA
jgi:NAD(P)-dependent dehydrogenase (short-subunit alcohol dehydrogenase family)